MTEKLWLVSNFKGCSHFKHDVCIKGCHRDGDALTEVVEYSLNGVETSSLDGDDVFKNKDFLLKIFKELDKPNSLGQTYFYKIYIDGEQYQIGKFESIKRDEFVKFLMINSLYDSDTCYDKYKINTIKTFKEKFEQELNKLETLYRSNPKYQELKHKMSCKRVNILALSTLIGRNFFNETFWKHEEYYDEAVDISKKISIINSSFFNYRFDEKKYGENYIDYYKRIQNEYNKIKENRNTILSKVYSIWEDRYLRRMEQEYSTIVSVDNINSIYLEIFGNFANFYDYLLKQKKYNKYIAPKEKVTIEEKPQIIKDGYIDLCIGLDVGTSTTKAVIKEIDYSKEKKDDFFYIVDFQEYGITGQEYLIPTYLCETNGIFSLPIYNKSCSHKNLKLNFMEHKENAEIYFRAYIALVIKYIEDWFEKTHGEDDIIKTKNIVWSVNLGIPSAQFNDDGENAKFLKVLKEAYRLSQLDNISINSTIKEEDSVDLYIIPEIVASIQSYIRRNDTSHEGLYCVSDIGAGTIDICTFRVKEDNDEPVYSFFQSNVSQLGTTQYQAAMLKYEEALSSLVNQKKKEIEVNSVGIIETNPEKYLIIDEIKQQQEEDINEYKTQIKNCFAKVLFRTLRNRDRYAQEWITTLPLALGGGGASIPFFKKFIKDDLTNWLTFYCGSYGGKRCEGFRVLDINANQKGFISEFKNIDCTRLNVALGLSYSIDFYNDENTGLKKYYKQAEIEDISAPQKEESDNDYILSLKQ